MGLTPIPIEDGELLIDQEFLDAGSTLSLLQKLLEETPWAQETITLFGKNHMVPRLTSFYGDQGVAYKYSGVVHKAEGWTEALQEIRHKVEVACNCNFNSVLLNLYRDGNDSMGWHSDDERELGENPTLASLSLGSERALRFRHKRSADKRFSIDLEDGSLLLMKGPIQHHWQHAISKSTKRLSDRINLTFRSIKTY